MNVKESQGNHYFIYYQLLVSPLGCLNQVSIHRFIIRLTFVSTQPSRDSSVGRASGLPDLTL